METMKVTTLPLLIAFIWLTSEVAAYPQPIEQIDAEGNDGTGQSCRPFSTDYSEFKEQLGNPLGLSETTMRLIAPPNAPSHQTDREARRDTCSFELAPNETHSLEVVR